jgi:SAM-dependent methyltransferase
VLGNAEHLETLEKESFDVALVLGPLLHLTEKATRTRCLSELKRVLQPGGTALVQYLNSWGLIKAGITDFPEWYDNPDRIRVMLRSRALEGNLKGFTDCFWSTPPEALAEAREAGFTVLTYAGAEGFLSGMGSELESIRSLNEDRYERIVHLAAEMSDLPQFRDSTDHLVLVVRKEIGEGSETAPHTGSTERGRAVGRVQGKE